MNTNTAKTLDAIAVFAILAIIGLATFASAESYSYNEKNTLYEIKLSGNSDSDNSHENETEQDDENQTTSSPSSSSSGGGYGESSTIEDFRDSSSKPAILFTSYVSVSISPEKQVSKDGKGAYEVTVKDLHKTINCIPENPRPCDTKYTYKLYFESKYGTDGEKKKILEGELEETEIELSPGEEKIIPLYVQTEFKGSHFFSITAESSDTKNSARGLFIYGNVDEEPSPSSYFEGEGFAINDNHGFLVDLNILNKDGTITGKMNFANEPHKISGTVENNEITFRIFSQKEEQVGNFEGTVTKYNDFVLLKGDLVLGNDALEVFELTAASKLRKVFAFEVAPTETSEGEQEYTQSTSINEIIAVQKPQEVRQGSVTEVQSDIGETTEFYVKPKEIIEKKYLWIIPSGKQILVVDVYGENGQVTEKKIEEYGSAKINDYSISVGSLENENSIEVSVNKVE